ncbi:MAG: flagellar hook-basal body complex protein FliE [Micrococcales bacterium]|uniref:flagellar hook-basal body complex protein FliE n=1 Tax=Phycicoccus sp. TaxID=1902410 RepID=UPI0019A4A77C|nr:flagellar hook-basal body complex protein FliE [Phycicoccus sp.]MBD3784292.1 flagellar hook-basal body complex protein FliE [Micrococcales bacterium]HMM96149.1 flagellar hook-basal body complex protein FliE [Phycicoccus sp.]
MSINPISSLGALPPVGQTTRAQGTQGTGFGQAVAQGLDQLDQLQKVSDTKAVEAVTGQLSDVHDYTIAANQAAVATQLTVAVRNKAVEAFTEIMRMPV